MNRIADGTSNTILVVEAANPVPWTKPDDIRYDPNRPVPKLGVSGGGANVLFADGSVFSLSRRRNDDRTLHLLIQRQDNQPVNFRP